MHFGKIIMVLLCSVALAHADARLRLIVETDAGGDPDDEQSLVRFLLYANESDVEGIIANRPAARKGENLNRKRTGLAIVRQLLTAYGQCWTKLVQHDSRYPTKDYLWQRTVAGYNDRDDAVDLIIKAVDRDDPRPLWYSDWGTDNGAATNNLKRALDRVLRERGNEGYARFKSKLRLTSYDKFAEHTTRIAPPFPLWVNTFQPPMDGKRWYHRFSALTATAGGFDIVRDVLTGHGPLGALYPTNTTHWQKEGDTMTFLYLVPMGANDPEQPTWGSWGGRYGPNTNFPGMAYYWASERDGWRGRTNRDNTVARWAAALQNDFAMRLDWCVKPQSQANHPPQPMLEGPLQRTVRSGASIELNAASSRDPDGDALTYLWEVYPEPGTWRGNLELANYQQSRATLTTPQVQKREVLHLLLTVTDSGTPALSRYGRVIITITPD
jgi:hypothetical protein